MQLEEALARNEAQLRNVTPGATAPVGPAATQPVKLCGHCEAPVHGNPLCTAFDELLDETIGGRS